MVCAIARDTGDILPCSVLLEGEYGRKGFSAGLPVRLGRNGMTEVVRLSLPPDEQMEFEKSMDILQETAAVVHQLLVGASTNPENE